MSKQPTMGEATVADVRTLAYITLAWSTLFVVIRTLLRNYSWSFCNRCASMIHVFVSVYLCTVSLEDFSHPLAGIGGPSNPAHRRAMVVSLGYFIYDFFGGLLDSPVDISNALHHVITIVGLGVGWYMGICGTEMVACLWLMEVSNPFMHARELLKELGIRDQPINLVNDLTFAAVFTFARLIVGPVVVYHTLRTDDPIVVKSMASGIQVVSIFWFYKIARVIAYKLNKIKKKKKSSGSGDETKKQE